MTDAQYRLLGLEKLFENLRRKLPYLDDEAITYIGRMVRLEQDERVLKVANLPHAGPNSDPVPYNLARVYVRGSYAQPTVTQAIAEELLGAVGLNAVSASWTYYDLHPHAVLEHMGRQRHIEFVSENERELARDLHEMIARNPPRKASSHS